eukprot:302679-Alexandrium_andersonii.AAC.1
MSASLVGSEMCIRDRSMGALDASAPPPGAASRTLPAPLGALQRGAASHSCLLYTSDAADDM